MIKQPMLKTFSNEQETKKNSNLVNSGSLSNLFLLQGLLNLSKYNTGDTIRCSIGC